MTPGPDDDTTRALVSNIEQTRARVASDVKDLAGQLTPAHLKDRALEVAERSAESVAWRAVRRLGRAPRRFVAYVRERPAAGIALGAGLALVVWRIAARRRR